MIEFNNTQNAIDDETKAELKEAFNNILATIDSIIAKNQLDSSKLQFESSAKVLEVADSIKTINNLEVNQAEVIEFAENVVDEVKTLAGKIVQEESDSEFQEINIDEEIVKELKIESITADADMSNGENLMQRQAPEEYALKAMINDGAEVFDVKVEAPQGLQNTQNVQFKQVDVNPSRILNQITKHFEGLQNNSKVNIVLNPESLGKVNIQLLTAKDGLTAQFTVTTQEAKDLLMKGLDGLKDSLVSQGVAVDNVSVKVADAQKSQYNQDWTEQEGSKGGNKEQERSNKEEKEKGLFEKMMAQVTDEENGNV
jgi:flagellar hook-length control protein FliK